MTKSNLQSVKGITTLNATVEIGAPQSHVWAVLEQPGAIERFHPLIKKSYMISETQKGEGAKRYCELLPMGAMEELITHWEEGQRFTTEVVGGKMLPPFRFMHGTIEIHASEGGTLANFSLSYQLKYGFWGRLMDLLLIRPQFKKAPAKYVEGLKTFVETGKVSA